jgi:hypothetical protein
MGPVPAEGEWAVYLRADIQETPETDDDEIAYVISNNANYYDSHELISSGALTISPRSDCNPNTGVCTGSNDICLDTRMGEAASIAYIMYDRGGRPGTYFNAHANTAIFMDGVPVASFQSDGNAAQGIRSSHKYSRSVNGTNMDFVRTPYWLIAKSFEAKLKNYGFKQYSADKGISGDCALKIRINSTDLDGADAQATRLAHTNLRVYGHTFPANGSIHFRDEFNNNGNGMPPTEPGPNWSKSLPEWGIVAGSAPSNGILKAETTPNTGTVNQLKASTYAGADGYVENAKVKLGPNGYWIALAVNGEPSNPNNYPWNAQNRLFVKLSPEASNQLLTRVTLFQGNAGQSGTNVRTVANLSHDLRTAFANVKAQVKGNRLIVFFNGSPIIDYTDPTNTLAGEGIFGLIAYASSSAASGATAYFDDVEVNPAGQVKMTQPQSNGQIPPDGIIVTIKDPNPQQIIDYADGVITMEYYQGSDRKYAEMPLTQLPISQFARTKAGEFDYSTVEFGFGAGTVQQIQALIPGEPFTLSVIYTDTSGNQAVIRSVYTTNPVASKTMLE